MKILVLNAGSSSQKSRLYELGESLPAGPVAALWEGNADWSERQGVAELEVRTAQGQSHKEKLESSARTKIIERLLASLWSGPTQIITHPEEIDIVGHRVVHGGPKYRMPTRVTQEVKEAIMREEPIAPAHNRANLEGIEAIERLLPKVPQVAVFDTGFHSQMPQAAALYPGPYEWSEQGIRRYGFHGISHHYCTQRAAQILQRDPRELRLVTCHLGNGCSLAAVREGHSIETTMGFTPLEGLMMGTRSGSLDPGLLLYLISHRGYDADGLDQTLNKASGLLGISGLSGDMRKILQARAAGNERARLAFEMFVHRLRFYIGAMLTVLGGVDALVFAGGIGEHAAEVRAAACETLGFLGLKLDEAKNAGAPHDEDIATADSRVRVLVVQTQEDWIIAQDCWEMAHSQSAG